MKWVNRSLTAVLLALAACAGPQPAIDHEAAWTEWREARHARLIAPEGWLSLVGQFWLEDGEYSVGGDPGCDLRIAGAPPRIGTLTVAGEEVSFTAAPETEVFADGEPAHSRELVVDVGGNPPTMLEIGSLSLFVVKRGELALRARDTEAPSRTAFAGLEYYPFDPDWRIGARFAAYDPPKPIEIVDAMGFVRPSQSPGALVFERAGVEYRLDAVSEPGEALFVMFADKTNGAGTYGAGRFVYADWPADGTTVLDFNRAYNPPCALTEYANCPLPPPGNRMRLAVEAGEKEYHLVE